LLGCLQLELSGQGTTTPSPTKEKHPISQPMQHRRQPSKEKCRYSLRSSIFPWLSSSWTRTMALSALNSHSEQRMCRRTCAFSSCESRNVISHASHSIAFLEKDKHTSCKLEREADSLYLVWERGDLSSGNVRVPI